MPVPQMNDARNIKMMVSVNMTFTKSGSRDIYLNLALTVLGQMCWVDGPQKKYFRVLIVKIVKGEMNHSSPISCGLVMRTMNHHIPHEQLSLFFLPITVIHSGKVLTPGAQPLPSVRKVEPRRLEKVVR